MPQEAEELDRMAGGRQVEPQAAPRARGEIIEMALAGERTRRLAGSAPSVTDLA
jgi:hypothetical protein